MKYGYREVLELMIFNEDGELISNLDTLKNSGLYVNTDRPYVYAKDALLDMNLMKYIGREEKVEKTEYEKALGKLMYQTSIVFTNNLRKKCKLIGKGFMRSAATSEDNEFLFEIPQAQIRRSVDWDLSSIGDPSEFDLIFEMLPYNDQGDLYKMHI